MAIDYRRDVEPLEQAGKTDEEIASMLSAVTVRPVQIADAENYFDFSLLARRSPRTGAWVGRLPDAMDNVLTPLPIRDGLSSLFGHINKPRSIHIDTTAAPWAEDSKALLDGLVATGVITAEERDGFYQLAGGRTHGDVTAGDVGAIRTQFDADEAERLVEQQRVNATALFAERMTVGGDADAVWTQSWSDAGAA